MRWVNLSPEQMCRRERWYYVNPSGNRYPREKIIHCEEAHTNGRCTRIQTVPLPDEYDMAPVAQFVNQGPRPRRPSGLRLEVEIGRPSPPSDWRYSPVVTTPAQVCYPLAPDPQTNPLVINIGTNQTPPRTPTRSLRDGRYTNDRAERHRRQSPEPTREHVRPTVQIAPARTHRHASPAREHQRRGARYQHGRRNEDAGRNQREQQTTTVRTPSVESAGERIRQEQNDIEAQLLRLNAELRRRNMEREQARRDAQREAELRELDETITNLRQELHMIQQRRNRRPSVVLHHDDSPRRSREDARATAPIDNANNNNNNAQAGGSRHLGFRRVPDDGGGGAGFGGEYREHQRGRGRSRSAMRNFRQTQSRSADRGRGNRRIEDAREGTGLFSIPIRRERSVSFVIDGVPRRRRRDERIVYENTHRGGSRRWP
jgi:hypothetical protein